MIEIIKQNKIILIILIVIVVAFVWFGMSDRQPSNSNLLSSTSRSGTSAAEQEILRLLLDMRSIRLDSSIFENPAFSSLRDFGRDIVPEPVGRTNPFEPTRDFFQLSEEEAAADAVFSQ